MNCITLRNPHAAAVVFGMREQIWRPDVLDEADFGPILIHASTTYDAQAKLHNYPLIHRRGQILGVAIIKYMGDPWGKLHAWVLGDTKVFREPVTWPGAKSVYDVPEEMVAEQLRRAMEPLEARDFFEVPYEPPADVVYPPTRGNWRGD